MNAFLASSLRSLDLNDLQVHIDEPEHFDRVLEKLTSQQHLHMKGALSHRLLSTNPIMPRLEQVAICGHVSDHAVVLVGQPKIQKLHLEWHAVPPTNTYPISRFLSLQNLFILAQVNPHELEALITMPILLKSLFRCESCYRTIHHISNPYLESKSR